MPWQLVRSASSTTSSGVAISLACWSIFALLMSQFWQNLQPRLQPVDPIEKKPLNHFLPGARVLSFGTEVVERLLLDGIDGEAGRTPVARAPQLSAPILADVAETRLSLADETVARAERAEELAALAGVPPARGVEVHGPRIAGRPRSAARGSEVRRAHGITARVMWGEDGDQRLRIARSTSY